MDDLYSNFSLNSSSTYEINSFSSSFDEEITQEDAWVIINKYFESKGLVRQQLDSFDEFLQNSIQELIDDAGEIKIIPEDQFLSDKQVDKVSFRSVLSFPFFFFLKKFLYLSHYFFLPSIYML